jgi:hypothetical protein
MRERDPGACLSLGTVDEHTCPRVLLLATAVVLLVSAREREESDVVTDLS